MQDKLETIEKLKRWLQEIKNERIKIEELYFKSLLKAYHPVTKEEYNKSPHDKIYLKGLFFVFHEKNLIKGEFQKNKLIIPRIIKKNYKESEERDIELIKRLKNRIKELEQELDNTTEE
ncbi:MAG: hypothetical protein JJT94_10295 [Bernardetiaceae bacterium]|nr:hypothetical protein [Bernardetiaceae bacterium]